MNNKKYYRHAAPLPITTACLFDCSISNKCLSSESPSPIIGLFLACRQRWWWTFHFLAAPSQKMPDKSHKYYCCVEFLITQWRQKIYQRHSWQRNWSKHSAGSWLTFKLSMSIKMGKRIDQIKSPSLYISYRILFTKECIENLMKLGKG